MRRFLTLLTAAVLTTASLTGSAGATGGGQSWVATWGTAVTGAATAPQPATVFENQTLRQVVHVSTGGAAVRVRLSNEYGTRPLVVGAARVARHATGSEIGLDRPLTFGGRTAVSIPAGAPAVSDPVRLPVAAGSNLAISIYLPATTPAATQHSSAFQRTYVAAGDLTRAASLPGAQETTSWYFLSGVSVTGSARTGAVVAFGDSITDGAVTTVDANHRWPDFLAERLRADRGLRHLGVVNAGIGGNRLLYDGNTLPDPVFGGLGPIFGDSALSRFDRDVAARPGAGTSSSCSASTTSGNRARSHRPTRRSAPRI